MSRFFWAFCALLIAAPLSTLATPPTEFQRPDAWRHAINAVIGDLSYIDKAGTVPPAGTDGDERVRIHLEYVHGLLSRGDVATLSDELRQTRADHLAHLQEYIDAGVFPRNLAYRDQNRPCFIDDDGRICAVGYLIEQSAGRDLAESINAQYQYAFLPNMHLRELDDWVASSGFTPLELTMIQPNYEPPPPLACIDYTGNYLAADVTLSGMTVTIDGYIQGSDYLCYGAPRSLVINFGEAIWSLNKIPSWVYAWWDGFYWIETTEWYQPVNVSHTYATAGMYTVTVDLFWGINEHRTWEVEVDGGSGGVNEIGDHGTPVVVKSSSWGAIKAMYR